MFDRFVMVDWSASSTPRSGRDSVWVADLHRDGRGEAVNPPTRGQAEALVRRILRDAVGSDERVLVGFDFPYGYPSGFAAALGRPGPAWRMNWECIAGEVHDDVATNRNDRFAAAARLNERLGTHLFWGRPASRSVGGISMKRDRVRYGEQLGPPWPSEWREVEVVLRGRSQYPQPAWKLYGNGSVGGQSLVGIPVVARLRDDPALSGVSVVWPFECLSPSLAPGRGAIVHAEIWPSIVAIDTVEGQVRDRAQVEALAEVYRELDRDDQLARAFSAVPEPARAEEGWILGVGDPPLDLRRPG